LRDWFPELEQIAPRLFEVAPGFVLLFSGAYRHATSIKTWPDRYIKMHLLYFDRMSQNIRFLGFGTVELLLSQYTLT
jgi:hypothetical protein